MTSLSILEQDPTSTPMDQGIPDRPAYFADLRLDKVEAALVAGNPDPLLTSVFRRPIAALSDIRFRQAVFKDLSHTGIRDVLTRFSVGMRETGRALAHAATLSQPQQRQIWKLEGARLRHAFPHGLSCLSPPACVSSPIWR